MIGYKSAVGVDVESLLVPAFDGLDRDAVVDRFRAQDEFVTLDALIPDGLLSALQDELADLRRDGHVTRSWVPFYKKGGSVGFFTLREHAPLMVSLYRSSAFRDFVSTLVGKPLHLCPDNDPHSCALFIYDEKGDRIGHHYDSCHYGKDIVYTVLIGLVQKSSAVLQCELYRERKDRETEKLDVDTQPGSALIYNGTSVYHGTTPIRRGEDRVVLSLEYLTKPYMHPLRRMVANIDHAIRYFGADGLFSRKRS